MNSFYIIIAIVDLIKYKVIFLFSVFCQISRVYVAFANLCYINVEQTHEVLLFREPRELFFLHNESSLKDNVSYKKKNNTRKKSFNAKRKKKEEKTTTL